MTKETILAAAAELGLTMSAEFVPLSKSRNANETMPDSKRKRRSLNWKVTLIRTRLGGVSGVAFLLTDYSAGEAHCPAYKLSTKGARGVSPSDKYRMIARECEEGRAMTIRPWGEHGGAAIMPDFADVLYSLSMDSDVLDAGGFEGWALELGYDIDSRKAEETYKACLEIALKMRSAIGDAGLIVLRTACQDY